MKKLGLLFAAIMMTTIVCSDAAFSQASAPSSDNKFKKAATSVGHGIMWGPKKIGAGLSKMGSGMKNMFHKKSK